jgi:hypothetical protein
MGVDAKGAGKVEGRPPKMIDHQRREALQRMNAGESVRFTGCRRSPPHLRGVPSRGLTLRTKRPGWPQLRGSVELGLWARVGRWSPDEYDHVKSRYVCDEIWAALAASASWRYAGRCSQTVQIMPKNRSNAATLRVARKAWIARADERAAKLAPIIKALQAKGVTSLSGIADALNKRRIRTARGVGQWQATQVARVLARLAG